MAHAQKPDFVFRWNERVHLNRRGRQFSRLLAAEVCASAVVMLDTPCFEVVWRVLATHYICQFPLHFPSRASPCAITFQLESTLLSACLVLSRRFNPRTVPYLHWCCLPVIELNVGSSLKRDVIFLTMPSSIFPQLFKYQSFYVTLLAGPGGRTV
jgi:hypothetical protein